MRRYHELLKPLLFFLVGIKIALSARDVGVFWLPHLAACFDLIEVIFSGLSSLTRENAMT